VLGPPALAQLMKSVANRFAAPHLQRLAGKPHAERVESVAEIIEARGNVVSRAEDSGEQSLRKHTCEYWNVATKNSIVCALDVEFVRQLVGADARLTTSLLRGDDCCTFHIKPEEAETPAATDRPPAP
jgi:predicted ArsR family transcriptional regulator